ncbi:MAG: NAD-dependent epimerase/dehydratase family protein [Methylacidiphilales bacterium]|nr:NAD-dependent epimerase/dehydratase family protein [Candidatus Methylacidiphilales bacterium]
MALKTLIIGCGYIGLPLALRLKEEGNEIDAWVHTAASAEALVPHEFHCVIDGSVADPRLWDAISVEYDFVIHCASSSRGGEAAYEEVFFQGAFMMGSRQPRARKLFVSSTSVYGQSRGELVTEDFPAEPLTPTGRILREAERTALGSGATVVRSTGIYGPNRGVLFERFRQGAAVIEGNGLRWINQIHQRDLVAALAHLIGAGAPGEIYNAADDSPVTLHDYYAWCAEFLGQAMPPYGPVDPLRKRGLTNKRVSNAKLRATGWQPMYPSFREGIAADYST